jgi:hypothetical protein
MKIIETLSVRLMASGYWQVKEVWQPIHGDEYTMLSAYTLDGEYIGRSKDAHRLQRRFGLHFVTREESKIAFQVAYCPAEGKWYGWSHRAIYGFSRRRDAERFARSVS